MTASDNKVPGLMSATPNEITLNLNLSLGQGLGWCWALGLAFWRGDAGPGACGAAMEIGEARGGWALPRGIPALVAAADHGPVSSG